MSALESELKSEKTVRVADHLWQSLLAMARDMGADRDALVARAVVNFAQLNGFAVKRAARAPRPVIQAKPHAPPVTTALIDRENPDGNTEAQDQREVEREVAAKIAEATAQPEPPVVRAEAQAEPVPEEPASPQGDARKAAAMRVAEILADVEKYTVPFDPPPLYGQAEPAAAREDEIREDHALDEEIAEVSSEDVKSVEAAPAPAPASAEDEIPETQDPDELTPPEGSPLGEQGGVADEQAAIAASARVLWVTAKDNPPVPMQNDRFVIGRGKHCDCVVESNRVSREHCAIVREGDALYIEDLKSSNGTWFQKQRITRKKIEDGDEFVLGTERLAVAFGPPP